MGAIIKKFGKKTAKHMADTKVRHKSWKKLGLKGPKYKIGKKVKGSHHLDEVWTFDKNYPKGKADGGRVGKWGGGLLKKIGKALSKKKPVKKDFKTDLSDYPTSKNIHKLIAKEQDPFVRNKLISIRDQAEKGTVIGKGGNVIQTPTKERTAKTLLERHPGSYQRKKPEGKK